MNVSITARLLTALDTFFDGVVRFLPGLLAALLILALGIVIAWAVRWVARRLLVLARFDRLAASLGISGTLAKADVATSPAAVVGSFLFWIVLASFLMAGLGTLDVKALDQLVTGFFLYLPRLFTALLVLLGGYLLGNFLARAALIAGVNAGLPSPRVFSLVVKVLIAILAFAMALEQLQIARSIVLAAFIISFGSLTFGLALAFGLGGREVARRALERRFGGDEQAERDDGVSHV